MERSLKNKENIPFSKSKPISSYYKVSKRLFESNKSEITSPASKYIQASPALDEDESPYLYEIRKKQNASKIFIKGISNSLNSAMDETPLKRSSGVLKQRMPLCSNCLDFSPDALMVSPSPKKSLMKALDRVLDIEEEVTLSGDFSQKCALSVIKGRHPELNTITAYTVANLLTTRHNYDITIIDCRYPYEFSAGHIKNAINLFSKETVEEDFFNLVVTSKQEKSARLLIFYCEFSSERAPSMMRFIRNRDRHLNVDQYPFVYYPEMYLIEGGYKSFFSNFKELCEPQSYKPMLAKENSDEYYYFKSFCKSVDQKLHKDSENR